jgi:predicted glycoside hydrolase/deacetylase ChbG (UPF0249 family)
LGNRFRIDDYLSHLQSVKRLIINADDLGVNTQRTHGIFICAEEGIVTSCSLLPNFADSNTAAKHARERDVDCGLHLNFTEGAPLSKQDDIRTLLTPDGFFLGRETFHRMLDAGDIQREHLEREARAQVEWIFDHYGPPTHLDSHHNTHIHPSIIPLLIPILDRYGISFVRITREHFDPPFEVSDQQKEYVAGVTANAEEAFKLYSASGIRSTDHFRGLLLSGNASLKNLRHIIMKLPEGTTELMVHPGSPLPYGLPFDIDPQRQTELRMLIDESIPELLKTQKVELISYRDLL